MNKNFVPRILIAGDEELARNSIGDKPCEILGTLKLNFFNDFKSLQIFSGEKALTLEDLKNILTGTADYIVFTDINEFVKCFAFLAGLGQGGQLVSLNTFTEKIHDEFFSTMNVSYFFVALKESKAKSLLDFDAFLAKNDLRIFKPVNCEIDCVSGSVDVNPIMENIYRRVYDSFSKCKFHRYDYILFTNERTPEELEEIFEKTKDTAQNILVFARANSPAERFITGIQNNFAKFGTMNAVNGKFFVLQRETPKPDIGIYICTHKDIKLKKLPPDYYVIHAGHANAKEEFGYIGDDTGENISRLNPFLNEMTAIYWIWKNTNHTHIGFNHYRRIFTAKTNRPFYKHDYYAFAEKFCLTEKEVLKIFSEYDVVVYSESFGMFTQTELNVMATKNPDLVRRADEIVKKHLVKKYPDYADAFDKVLKGYVMFNFNMFIMRKNIFDAYCEWLFSFLIDATEEVMETFNLRESEIFSDRRICAFISERLLTVWLINSGVKIKDLPIMYRDDV